jgi:hypothetical protein
MVKNLTKRASSREDHLPKTLFTLSRCRITEDDGSRDLLSRSQMHVDKRDEVASAAAAVAAKPRCVGVFVAVGILLFPWRPHVYIGKTCLGLQRPVTD